MWAVCVVLETSCRVAWVRRTCSLVKKIKKNNSNSLLPAGANLHEESQNLKCSAYFCAFPFFSWLGSFYVFFILLAHSIFSMVLHPLLFNLAAHYFLSAKWNSLLISGVLPGVLYNEAVRRRRTDKGTMQYSRSSVWAKENKLSGLYNGWRRARGQRDGVPRRNLRATRTQGGYTCWSYLLTLIHFAQPPPVALQHAHAMLVHLGHSSRLINESTSKGVQWSLHALQTLTILIWLVWEY